MSIVGSRGDSDTCRDWGQLVRQSFTMGDSGLQDALCVRIWSDNAPAAYKAFLHWAEPRGSVHVLFNPDSMLAIDSEEARGFLVDDVYLVLIWIDRGQDSFSASLDSELSAIGLDVVDITTDSHEPNPGQILSLIMDRGSGIDSARHLL